MLRLTGSAVERAFLDRVIAESGQNLRECLQCGKCSAGCPITSEEIGGPRQLIARILTGMKTEALSDPTWLYCVSCGTCATRCPVEINMYQVSTALCELAREEGAAPSDPDIHLFEDLFLKSVRRNGRVQELKTVLAFNLRTWQPFKDMVQGAALLRKGAVSPFEIMKAARRNEGISRIFAQVFADPNGE